MTIERFILIMVVINFGICLFLLIKLLKTDKKDKDLSNEIKDFKFHEQTQFMHMQKSLADEFSGLKENILVNINKYNEQTIREILIFHNNMKTDLYEFNNRLQKELRDNMEIINNKVEFRLNEGFAKTTQTFNNILERISKIDEAQKKIESLSTNIISLQDVLTDKKARGAYGEIQLKQIMVSTFGENNTKIYELQKKLSNDKIVDAILYTPKPLGNICIDSKFPLENYKRMVDKNLSKEEILISERKFKQDVKKHIDDIRDKYIIPNETADSAIMFVPAEAIFAEINAYHQDLINYSQQSHVWIASPTTLMFLLTTVQVILQNMERDKYSALIHEELNKLGVEFKRYKERWTKLSNSINQVSQSVKELHITSDKIEKHFNSLSHAEIDKNRISLDFKEEENNESSN
ncbi:MAG TPA: DNA recombination protein RmuC [Haloplasmataceae bacterium]